MTRATAFARHLLYDSQPTFSVVPAFAGTTVERVRTRYSFTAPVSDDT